MNSSGGTDSGTSAAILRLISQFDSESARGTIAIPHIYAYSCGMRRKAGVLIPIELSILRAAVHLHAQGEHGFHGFRLAKEISEERGARLLTGHGTLYRALGRLKNRGYLESHWEDAEIALQQNRPRRKLYRLTGAGRAALSRSDISRQSEPIWEAST